MIKREKVAHFVGTVAIVSVDADDEFFRFLFGGYVSCGEPYAVGRFELEVLMGMREHIFVILFADFGTENAFGVRFGLLDPLRNARNFESDCARNHTDNQKQGCNRKENIEKNHIITPECFS